MMQVNKAPTVTGEWECTECGYIIEGTEAKRPAHCPECDAPADALEFLPNEDDAQDDWAEDGDDEESDALDDDDYEDDDDDYNEDLDDDEELDGDDDY